MTSTRRTSSRVSLFLAPRSALRWIALSFAALLLAGCATGYGMPGGSYGGGGYGTGGYGDGGYGDYGSQRVQGTVQDLDTRYGRLVLSGNDGYGSRGSQLVLRVDRNTRLFYQGQEQAVTGLERGDGVNVEVVRSNGELWARRIDVVHNVRDGGGGYYGGNTLDGAISFVDPRSQVIGLTRGGYSGRREQVRYDNRTVVEYRGRRVRPEQLETGDVVRIQARQWGNGWLAERIVVERSIRDY